MNILLSTTTGWNIGDDFIRFGCQYLLEKYFQKTPTYIYYDRNPDFFTPGIWQMGSNHKSNRMMNPINWKIIDLVVLAGSPEFLHGPLKPLYEGLMDNPHIPMIALGVGYSLPKLSPLTKEELTVLKRPNVKISTRQESLKDQLQNVLQRNDIVALPCPALFCTDYKLEYTTKEKDTGVIVQAPGGFQAIDESLANKLLNIPGNKLCHYIKEYEWLQEKNIQAFYNPEPEEFLKEIAKYKTIHSSRLHGCIAALSNYAHVIPHYSEDNFRIIEGLKMYENVLGCSDPQKIIDFKIQTEEKYFREFFK